MADYKCTDKRCIHWRSLGGSPNNMHACHHLLDTGKRRVVKDGLCMSRCIPTKMRRKKPNEQSKD